MSVLSDTPFGMHRFLWQASAFIRVYLSRRSEAELDRRFHTPWVVGGAQAGLLLAWTLLAVEMKLEYDGGGWVVNGFEVSDGTLCPVSAGSGA